METKVKHAKELIEKAVHDYSNISVACSFGKDSMVVTHIAKEVFPGIPIFSIMTMYKPLDTFTYLDRMNDKMKLNATIYIVCDVVPTALWGNNIIVLPTTKFKEKNLASRHTTSKELYESDPDECCNLLKVEPTKLAVKGLDAWICGLRCNEGRTRIDYQEVEEKGDLIKVNPILTFTETDIWKYIATRGIEPHPWYSKGYRSLGCEPCSNPGGELERSGRWRGTSKVGGECGIHTQILK